MKEKKINPKSHITLHTSQNSGITLVALIITIIVLLILAVVAIRAVQGDGVIGHAKNARDQYAQAEVNETATLQNYVDYINKVQSADSWDNSDANCFIYEEGKIVGLTELGIDLVLNHGKTEFTIPNRIDGQIITSIGDSLFNQCEFLTKINIPESVTSIGHWAFKGCTALNDITVHAAEGDINFTGSGLTDEQIANIKWVN